MYLSRIFHQGIFGLQLALMVLLTISHSLAASTTVEENRSAPNVMAACPGAAIHYQLGPKNEINRLYPVIKTESMSDYDYSMAVAASIQLNLRNSLARDQIYNCSLSVTPAGDVGYGISFYSPDPKAGSYVAQGSWLNDGKLGLKDVLSCQGDKSCWEPTKDPSGADLTCSGPWQFYLPLGLPMVSQRLVMFLHYPPYVAMQQSDYLNNATLNRWRRLLETVGVDSRDWTLYTAIVDAFPIAAPGSGETGCFPSISAMHFFGDYISTMLKALAIPPSELTTSDITIPVIIFGREARDVWNSMYPDAQTDVLKAGRVVLDAKTAAGTTPYIGANHPIAAVYSDCSTNPTIVTVVQQDLTTACFAKTMAETPNADPATAAAACRNSYFSSPDREHSSQICRTAVMDKSPHFITAACKESYFSTVPEAGFTLKVCAINEQLEALAMQNRWKDDKGIDRSTAQQWCDEHENQVCPNPPWASSAP